MGTWICRGLKYGLEDLKRVEWTKPEFGSESNKSGNILLGFHLREYPSSNEE
jgi:hypothetical protein